MHVTFPICFIYWQSFYLHSKKFTHRLRTNEIESRFCAAPQWQLATPAGACPESSLSSLSSLRNMDVGIALKSTSLIIFLYSNINSNLQFRCKLHDNEINKIVLEEVFAVLPSHTHPLILPFPFTFPPSLPPLARLLSKSSRDYGIGKNCSSQWVRVNFNTL